MKSNLKTILSTVRIIEILQKVFKTEEQIFDWLKTEHAGFGDKKPIDLILEGKAHVLEQILEESFDTFYDKTNKKQ